MLGEVIFRKTLGLLPLGRPIPGPQPDTASYDIPREVTSVSFFYKQDIIMLDLNNQYQCFTVLQALMCHCAQFLDMCSCNYYVFHEARWLLPGNWYDYSSGNTEHNFDTTLISLLKWAFFKYGWTNCHFCAHCLNQNYFSQKK